MHVQAQFIEIENEFEHTVRICFYHKFVKMSTQLPDAFSWSIRGENSCFISKSQFFTFFSE